MQQQGETEGSSGDLTIATCTKCGAMTPVECGVGEVIYAPHLGSLPSTCSPDGIPLIVGCEHGDMMVCEDQVWTCVHEEARTPSWAAQECQESLGGLETTLVIVVFIVVFLVGFVLAKLTSN